MLGANKGAIEFKERLKFVKFPIEQSNYISLLTLLQMELMCSDQERFG